MANISQPHDSFFRDSFSQRELAIALCRNYLPQRVAAALDPDPAAWELCDGNYVDDKLGGHVTDLLYLTRLIGGGDVYILLLLEHKSRPDRFVALQLLRYMVLRWEQDHREHPRQPLRPILPLVVYHGRERWRVPTNFASLLAEPTPWSDYCPDFQYLLLNFSRHAPPPTAGDPRLLARLLALRAAFGEDLEATLNRVLDHLAQLRDMGLLVREWRLILLYIGATPAGALAPGVDQVAIRVLRSRGAPMVNQWLKYEDSLRAEGRQQGMEQGLEEGLRQGIALALELKFGTAGRGLMPSIDRLPDARRLQVALEAVRSAKRPEDLAQELATLAEEASGQ